jgi:hypothetical protein
MTNLFSFVSMLFMIVISSCEDTSINPPPQPIEKQWEEVTLFKYFDIRYMVTHKERLYVSAVYHSGASDSSVLFTTVDGNTWDTLKTFIDDTGPLAFSGDTLTVLETGRIWDYHPSFGWRVKYKTLIDAGSTFDMFYLNHVLYVFERRDYAFSIDTIRAISRTPVESRFIKHSRNGKEIAYTMPYYVYLGCPYWFDGYDFYSLENGILPTENKLPNYPSLYIHKDTLYAGFNTPTRIKKLVDDIWINVTDTIPNTKDANLFNPTLPNTASSILFQNNRMFVGTERTGILEWADSRWVSISNGLQKQFPGQTVEIYTPIIFLESINGTLFTGFGEPGFAPLYNGRGLFKYKLN